MRNEGKEFYNALIGKDEIWDTVLMIRKEIISMFDVSIMMDIPCDNILNLTPVLMFIYRIAVTHYGCTWKYHEIALMMPYWCDEVTVGLNGLLDSLSISHRRFRLHYSDGCAQVIYG